MPVTRPLAIIMIIILHGPAPRSNEPSWLSARDIAKWYLGWNLQPFLEFVMYGHPFLAFCF